MSVVLKYLNIPFKHCGRSASGVDCYGLVYMFYKNELGIKLPEYHYEAEWMKQGLDLIQKNYWEHFEHTDRIKKYCIVTFKGLQTKIVSHMGIMIDDISFLHVPHSLLVCMDKITNIFWKKTVYGYFIYKG